MLQIAGLVIVLLLVGGGLVITGGPATMEALPFELALIGGAALGTVLLGNAPDVAREAFSGFARAFRGAHWTKQDYADFDLDLEFKTADGTNSGVIFHASETGR